MNGLRISEPLDADVEDVDNERGHRSLRIVRKGGKHVTVPLAPHTSRTHRLNGGVSLSMAMCLAFGPRPGSWVTASSPLAPGWNRAAVDGIAVTYLPPSAP